MKELQSNFTTTDQSKRLLELGVPADSADCYYGSYPGHPDWAVIRQSEFDTEDDALFRLNEDIIPCWSVGRLMEIVDICCKWNFYEDWLKYRISDETIGIPIEHIVSTLEYLSSDNSIDFSKLEG